MRRIILALGILLAPMSYAGDGILVIAHGSHMGHDGHCYSGSPSIWEQHVLDVVDSVTSEVSAPITVAFGMWNTACYNEGIARLRDLQPVGQDLTHLTVLPLFISSHSLVIEMQKYIFGLRSTPPISMEVPRIDFQNKITYLPAINYSKKVSNILAQRAASLLANASDQQNNEPTVDPANAELVLVMHGPVGDADNHRWLADAHQYAADLSVMGFADIHVVSLQDDAEEPVWIRAKEKFRQVVQGTSIRGNKALILPLLLSPGGIEAGIHSRLADLDYIWTGETLLPDVKLGQFILERVKSVLP